LLHPLFVIGYVMLFLMWANPYLFGFSGDKAEGLVVISIVSISVLFPMISILMMKALGLISTLEMKDKNERIGPLIVTGLFYMWLYVNIRNNDSIPAALSFFVLGCTISVFLALIINSFTKISLHTIAAGGLATGMMYILFHFTYGHLDVAIPVLQTQFRMSDRLILMIIMFTAGAVGASRLYLKAHKENEIYGGYVVGILSQLIAIRIFF
ncbi:MAG: hypothetical protein RIR48_2628, partial [Bacteroidota bacterium]